MKVTLMSSRKTADQPKFRICSNMASPDMISVSRSENTVGSSLALSSDIYDCDTCVSVRRARKLASMLSLEAEFQIRIDLRLSFVRLRDDPG
jgi:hypothetical protein